MHRMKTLIFLGVLAFAPAASATVFTGTFTTGSGASQTFTNFGTPGVSIAVLCGVGSSITTGTTGGNSCALNDGNGATAGTPLGITSTGGGDSTWIDGHTTTTNIEYLLLQFASNVTLKNITLDVSATSGWSLYSCTTAAASSCTSTITSATNTAANAAFSPTAFSTPGRYFALYANNNATTAFALTSLTFDTTVTPEPSTFVLLGSALLGVVALRRKKNS